LNHYFSLVVLAAAVTAVFVVISREAENRRLRYALNMLGYMIVGSLLAGWLMTLVPW
jgi:hypothetical protein